MSNNTNPKRGRPPLKFRNDPDRYVAALALALRALGMSLRGGCEAAIASTEGAVIGPNITPGRGGHGLNLLDWNFEMHRVPGAAFTIKDRARGLRKKIKKCARDDPDAARWLGLMRDAFLVALQTAPLDPNIPADLIMKLAAEAGESDYAADKLLKIRHVRSRLKALSAWRVVDGKGLSPRKRAG